MFKDMSNENKLAIAINALLSKIDNGEKIREQFIKTLDLKANNCIYEKYISTELDDILYSNKVVTYNRTPYISNFNELSNIGTGSFANVYKVHHKLDNCDYAIKKVLINEEDEPIAVLSEIRLLALMTYHPNIVRYFYSWLDISKKGIEDFYDEDDLDGNNVLLNQSTLFLCIQMELCEYTLRDYMTSMIYNNNGEKRLTIWQGILAAVQHLHYYNIMHRDIKPSNIFFKNNVVKLGDFGMARINDNIPITEEKSDEIGCSYYRAPEISSRFYDESIDVFSIGVILIELLLQYNTMSEKDHLIRNMFKTRIIPKLINMSHNSLIKKMISTNPLNRPKSLDIII